MHIRKRFFSAKSVKSQCSHQVFATNASTEDTAKTECLFCQGAPMLDACERFCLEKAMDDRNHFSDGRCFAMSKAVSSFERKHSQT